MITVFDIDGVLADHRHRFKFIEKTPKDWNAYYDHMQDDPVLEATANILRSLHSDRHLIILATGRPETYRERTCDWLERAELFQYVTDMYMRADGDYRPNPEVKDDHAQGIIKVYGRIGLAFEDDPRSIEVWKKYTHQVCEVKHGL